MYYSPWSNVKFCYSAPKTLDFWRNLCNTNNMKNNQTEAMFQTRSYSELAGHESVFFNVALEGKEEWPNGIFQNAHFAQFVYHVEEGKLSLIAKHYEMPKFRKCNVKCEEECLPKLQEYARKSLQLVGA